MRMRVSPVAVLLPGLLLGACSGLPPHAALPNDAEDKIASTDVVLPIHQNEIYVYVPNSNGGAVAVGGILGALIDSGINDVRTTKAETAVKPLRDALVDYNFDKGLQGDLKDALAQDSFLHAEGFNVVREVTNDKLDAVLDASKDSTVLFISVDYCLSNDGDVLDILATASLFPKDDVLKSMVKSNTKSPKTAPANALYRNNFVYELKLPGTTDDRDKNVAMWSADNGAAMRAALDQGAKVLASMVAADLKGGDQPAAGAAKVTTQTPVAQIPVDVTGQVVTSDSAGQILRFDDGTMKYIASAAPPPATASAPAAAPAPAAATPANSAPSASANSAKPAS